MEYNYIAVFIIFDLIGLSAESHNPPAGCEDKGLVFYDCDEMRGWYHDVNTFCKDYGQTCCLTCITEADDFHFTTTTTTTTTRAPECTDKGFFGFGCTQMQLWYATFDEFCYDNKDDYCCATCRDRNIACNDFGFAGYSCSLLRRWTPNLSKFCKNWRQYCCKTCS